MGAYREGVGYGLADNLKRLRTERGYTQRHLAGLANVSPSYIQNIEKNQVTNPGCFPAYRLALALRVTLEELMGVSSLHSRGRISRGRSERLSA
jgi:transcriptional regulator with XRE-family HTH domain